MIRVIIEHHKGSKVTRVAQADITKTKSTATKGQPVCSVYNYLGWTLDPQGKERRGFQGEEVHLPAHGALTLAALVCSGADWRGK